MDNTEHANQDVQERNEQIGGMAGMGAGMLVGARVGTTVLPIPVVGTFAGAMLGGLLGTAVGRRVGASAYGAINSFLDSLAAPPKRDEDTPDLV